MTYAVVRVRGTQNINPKVRDTLKSLRLHRINHCVVVPRDATTEGMLRVAKDYVTWGETDKETLAEAIKARGRLIGDAPITDTHVKTHTDFASIDAWAAAIAEGKARYGDLPDVKPLLRLHPARQGLEGIKRSVKSGGALGYRGEEINKLLRRMI